MIDRLPRRLRGLARRLPSPMRRVGKQLLQRRRRPGPPSPPLPRLPTDVADEEALRELLMANAAVFGDPAEARNYLNDALLRFRVTMSLLPDLPGGAKVLELGSNPYFITRLLRRRGLDVTCANWFGAGAWPSGQGRQTIPGAGGDEVFEFDHFNIEESPFPYPAETFRLVLFCEILEHLPADPVHALAEIHRVLEPRTGTLVLTTPNAIRTDRLAAILRGDNVYEAMSGYGAYGRHNREYTVSELRRLLNELGYRVELVEALDVHRSETVADWPPTASPAGRADNLFCVAQATGDIRWRYPRWLFQSVHGLYGRVVRPDVRMGYNDDLQTIGLAEPSESTPELRWTGTSPARLLLSPDFSGHARLVVEGRAGTTGQPSKLRLALPDQVIEWEVSATGQPWRHVAEVACNVGRLELELTVLGSPVGLSRAALERP